MTHRWLTAATALVLLLVSGCVLDLAPSPRPTSTPTAVASPSPSPSVTSSPTAAATASAEPTASPEPTLALDLPEKTDDRAVSVQVEPRVGGDGGEITVTVTSEADERIDELVLRWPRGLNRTLFLRPFVPSDARLAPGQPLVQNWTKWVLGPGEDGEPRGTVSLGYGPLLAGATLTIPLDVVRRADGPVEFDLQVLAQNSVLTLPDGEPAELRIEIP
jgi:hypothetical protein